MEKICIFVDSASDLTHELAEKWNIDVVPIQITVGGKTLREYYDITPQEYWDMLQNSSEFPQTAQVSIEEFQKQFKKAKDAGCTHCIGLLINSNGSGTYQTATIVRDMFYEEYGEDMKIELIDSKAYSFLYGCVAVAGAQLREVGASYEEIVTAMRSQLKCMRAHLGIYSLRHLKKSGRISGGAAFVGEALGLRPIACVMKGEVNVMGKVRGDRAVVPKLAELVSEDAVDRSSQTAYVAYAAVPEDQISEAEQLLRQEGFANVQRIPLGAAITTNTGPKSIAVIFRGEPWE